MVGVLCMHQMHLIGLVRCVFFILCDVIINNYTLDYLLFEPLKLLPAPIFVCLFHWLVVLVKL